MKTALIALFWTAFFPLQASLAVVCGEEEEPAQFPEVVRVQVGADGEWSSVGTGVVIAPHLVLTASHLLFSVAKTAKGPVSVCVGHGYEEYEDDPKTCASAVYLHPSLPSVRSKFRTTPNDLMILRFSKPVFKTFSSLVPGTTLPKASKVLLVGYGLDQTSTSGRPASYVRFGENVLKTKFTSKDSLITFRNKMSCAWEDQNGRNVGLAPGDSGAPLFITRGPTKVLVGIGMGGFIIPGISHLMNRQTSRFVSLLRVDNRLFIESAINGTPSREPLPLPGK